MIKQKLIIFISCFLISSCAELGKGITEAILEKQFNEDTRNCEVKGNSFLGISPHLTNQQGKMKLLMTHGVGNHLPGYATEFAEKLAKELNLSVTSKSYKDITLIDPLEHSKKLGNLRIQRFLDKAKKKELLFYELTWSDITSQQKAILNYDNSGEHSFRRAKINDMMKKFSNDTAPDPIIYLGESRNDILQAFIQSFCWMTSGVWKDLPSEGTHTCVANKDFPIKHIINDEYAFVSHSLGSRITIDGLQKIAEELTSGKFEIDPEKREQLAKALQAKKVDLYMMSNQLPMLQLGRKLPDITSQKNDYCQTNGKNFAKRMLTKTSIIAFSDPNDLLSYAIPDNFVDNYLDSRLCAEVTNININVAKVFDVFTLGEVANPLDAHVNYDTDDRVIGLIAKGIGNKNTAKIVKKRCQWIETIE